jgi:hypothetical protein
MSALPVPAHRRPPGARSRAAGARARIGSLRRRPAAAAAGRQDRDSRPAPAELAGLLGGCRRAALAAIAVLVFTASLVSFAESYRGLYEWAGRHGISGIWVAVWPLQVDVFIAVGELTLFVALADQWRLRWRAGAWAVTAAGLGVSVAGNVGHVAGHSMTNRGTAAVPPLAAAAAMAVGLGVLKRVVQSRTAPPGVSVPPPLPPAAAQAPGANGRNGLLSPAVPPAAAPGPADPAAATDDDIAAHYADQIRAGQVPSAKAIRSQWHVGSGRAGRIHGHLAAAAARASAGGDREMSAPPATIRP